MKPASLPEAINDASAPKTPSMTVVGWRVEEYG